MTKISPEAADAIGRAFSHKQIEHMIRTQNVNIVKDELRKEQKELKRFNESYYGKVIRNEPE